MNMLARTFALLLLCACTTAPPRGPDQPELARLAAPYAADLRAVGIQRMTSPGRGDLVRLDTYYGAVYIRYPAGVAPMAFVLEVDPDHLAAASTAVDAGQFSHLMDVLVPDAVRETASNNAFEWARANPWN
ncbi:MAG TPA: hypothetical protein VGR63_15855 [Casimicrobiaceae bacterium]|jgi:hypothetical protein|nr:hypothetical protein [Casimicrobiaceae bacterium]